MPPHYILDTNIFVHLVRNDAVGRRIIGRYRLMSIQPVPVYSVVTAGEILSFAHRNDWGIDKLDHLEFLLDYFACQYLDARRFADLYTYIDRYSQAAGYNMGKNDLWIAAAALSDEFTLLTNDRDFDHLTPKLIRRDWIDPNGAATQ